MDYYRFYPASVNKGFVYSGRPKFWEQTERVFLDSDTLPLAAPSRPYLNHITFLSHCERF